MGRIDYDRFSEFESSILSMVVTMEESITAYDLVDLLNIKQGIIIFAMHDRFGEQNIEYLGRVRDDFYEDIRRFEMRHPESKIKTSVIKKFMEEYYFNIF